MFILTDLSDNVIQILKTLNMGEAGVIQVRGVTHIQLLGKNGNYVGVVGLIKIKTDIDSVFEKIREEMIKASKTHGKFPKELLLQGGGTLPIPDWFREWCQQNGILIRVLDVRSILEGHIEIGKDFYE